MALLAAAIGFVTATYGIKNMCIGGKLRNTNALEVGFQTVSILSKASKRGRGATSHQRNLGKREVLGKATLMEKAKNCKVILGKVVMVEGKASTKKMQGNASATKMAMVIKTTVFGHMPTRWLAVEGQA